MDSLTRFSPAPSSARLRPSDGICLLNHEGVVFSQGRPRPARHFTKIYKSPVGHVRFVQSETVTHGWRDIESGAFVQIGFWPFVAKHILPMIGAERSGVFPLGIDCSTAFTDRHPTIFTGGNGRALICLPEPRHNARRFGPMASACLIVVGKRAVKRVLPRRELYGNVIAPVSRIWVVKSAVASRPLFVPGACPIRHRIVSPRLFADPKDSCHDACFPRIAPCSLRGGRFSNEGLAVFGDRFDLSGKGRIKCDEEGETKKAK